jgi:hypothetical protein
MSLSNEIEKKVSRDQLLTIGDLDDFRIKMLEEFKLIVKDITSQPTKKWLKSSEARKILPVSPGTFQNLRVNGTLNYSKIGGLVFYKYEDLVSLLEKFYSKQKESE